MRLTVRAAAAIGGAIGAWLALGATAIAPGVIASSRIGVLPPWWVLGLLTAFFLALVFGWRVRAWPLPGGLLCGLPWVPGAVPASLLAWQGLLAAMVWAGILMAVVASGPLPFPSRWRGWVGAPSRAPWLAAALAAATFGFAWGGSAAWLPGGDEPHYLIITQSLLADGDLRIENNHQQLDYLAYFPGELRPDYLRRGTDRQIYSIHAPGVSALVAPAFLLGGYRGAVLFLLVTCALGTALAWRLAWETTREAGAAWFGWAVLVTAIPIVAHAHTIYPDGVSGVLALVGVFAFVRAARPARWPLVAGGVALALLPWLHTRNVLIAAGLALAILARTWRCAPRGALAARLGAFLVAPAVSAAAWFAFFRVIYGTFDPSAPYGGYTQTSWQNILRGVPGLLFDQQFGAFSTAPALIVAIVGTLILVFAPRRPGDVPPSNEVPPPRALAAMLAMTAVPYVLITASYHMWWGGTSAPARFLVPVLWLAALPAAVAWGYGRRAADRGVWLGLLVLSAVFTVAMSHGGLGLLTFTTRASYGPFQEWATRAVDLSMALPSVLRDGPLVATGQAALWGLALAGWWLALRVLVRSVAAVAACAVPLAVLAASLAMDATWAIRGVDALRPDASRRALLDAAWLDGVGVSFQRFEVDGRRRRAGPAPVAQLLPLLELRTMSRGHAPGSPLTAIAGLPAGDYRVKVSSTEPASGRVRLEVGRGGVLADHDLPGLAAERDRRRFFDVAWPVGVEAVTVAAGEDSTATGATVTPLRLRPPAEQPLRDAAILARRYSGADVFFTTDGQYAERDGIWFKAGAVPVVVRPRRAGASGVAIFLRNGPRPNVVELASGGWREQLSLLPGQEASVEWPWSAGARERVLEVRTAEAFRPADVDPASQDLRRLGVWIEFR